MAICMRDLFALFVLAFVRGQRQLKAGCLEPLCCLWLLHSSACPTVRPIVPPPSPLLRLPFIVCLPACIIQQSKKRQLSGEYCFLFALQLPFSIAWRITRKHTHTESEVCTTKRMPQKGPHRFRPQICILRRITFYRENNFQFAICSAQLGLANLAKWNAKLSSSTKKKAKTKTEFQARQHLTIAIYSLYILHTLLPLLLPLLLVRVSFSVCAFFLGQPQCINQCVAGKQQLICQACF